jgi:hypothetical protein
LGLLRWSLNSGRNDCRRVAKKFVLLPVIRLSARKPTIWKLLNVEQEIGVTLTESMWPASSVSGYYFGSGK